MKATSSRIATAIWLLFFTGLYAVAQEPTPNSDYIVDSPSDVIGVLPGETTDGATAPARPPNASTRVIPDSASTHYGRGNAPFYVRAKSYALQLQRALDRSMSPMLERETTAMGIDTDTLEVLVLELAQIRNLENLDWSDTLRSECAPLLRGAVLSNEEAMEKIARIDDTMERRERIARSVMSTIAQRHGADLAARLEARIVEHGEPVEFSKSDMVKVIAAVHDGDYLAWLSGECNAL